MRAAFVGMTLVAAGVFILMLLPLVVFFGEMISSPDMFMWEWSLTPQANGSSIRVVFEYGGTVPLREFSMVLKVDNAEYILVSAGEVRKGTVLENTLTLPSNVLENGSVGKLGFVIGFRIAGLYWFELVVENG